MSNGGCLFIPGFKYLLERYLVMSSMPDTNVACLPIRALPMISEMLPTWSVCPTISQNMLVGWHTASIWVPFLVHRSVPRSESIDFSHEGSFSTSHLGILLSLCTILTFVVSQFIGCAWKIELLALSSSRGNCCVLYLQLLQHSRPSERTAYVRHSIYGQISLKILPLFGAPISPLLLLLLLLSVASFGRQKEVFVSLRCLWYLFSSIIAS